MCFVIFVVDWGDEGGSIECVNILAIKQQSCNCQGDGDKIFIKVGERHDGKETYYGMIFKVEIWNLFKLSWDMGRQNIDYLPIANSVDPAQRSCKSCSMLTIMSI